MVDKSAPKRAVSKPIQSNLAKQKRVIERTKREVLDRGAKFLKPLGLAKHKVVKLTGLILGFLVVALIIGVAVAIYAFKNDNALVYRVSRIVPFPVARVNGNFVGYDDYLFEVRYRKNIYEHPSGPASNQQAVDFDTPAAQDLLHQIQNASLERAKLKAVLTQLAKREDIKVARAELDAAMTELIERQGGAQKFESAIEQFYGWNVADFRGEYYMQLLEQKLQLAMLPDLSTKEKALAESLVKRARAGANFTALAKKYSDDPGSKDSGGDLGFVSTETGFVEEFKSVALKLNKGDVSDVVASRFGFHIIKATDKKGDEVKVSHILINYGQEMEAVLTAELAKAKIKNFISLPEVKTEDTAPAAS
ncbi:peptidylprolyl isomerase [Candidatus Microgenomates bacterium]|nr:peptidylprolyl isomerase [Candidatus Microgenomates bacterium]